ncbi:hypothetical protein BCR34DRAFT_633708 [Clohesyomyces aquaticus]|uniref:Uncharacterized protein n=1 Tax=Clohesyomyces aquaticus TaxID=1231657 RepID=A0A1Y1Z4S1_9PLEO|nr:hypothetical protein BCR34DRAFT_633708 [Clohesyomyces aquaticus]
MPSPRQPQQGTGRRSRGRSRAPRPSLSTSVPDLTARSSSSLPAKHEDKAGLKSPKLQRSQSLHRKAPSARQLLNHVPTNSKRKRDAPEPAGILLVRESVRTVEDAPRCKRRRHNSTSLESEREGKLDFVKEEDAPEPLPAPIPEDNAAEDGIPTASQPSANKTQEDKEPETQCHIAIQAKDPARFTWSTRHPRRSAMKDARR